MADYQMNRPPRVGRRFPIEAEDDAEFIRKVRDLYSKDVQADYHNMIPAREDLQFVIGDQWNQDVKRRREAQRKPVITVNRLPAFVGQYIGSFLQNDTTMKLAPIHGGSKMSAEVRQGMVRTVMRTNAAKIAKKTAAASQYMCGIGNFMLEVVDAEYDVFARDMAMSTLDDPFQVIWDRASTDPTGKDANHCFVFDYMTREDFKKAYPDHEHDSGWYTDDLDATIQTLHGWDVEEMVRVCYFWQMHHEDVKVGLEAETGDVIDVTGMSDKKIAEAIERDEEGNPLVRETTRPYALCTVMTTQNILEEPYRLNISRVPVFRCEGWVITEGTVRHRWGFVRNAKDPQRIHNFWRSILAEELMKSPSAKWLIDSAAGKNGVAERFRQAHRSGDNVIEWDSQAGGAKPEFIQPPQINQAVLTEAEMTVRDIKDVTNRHEASLGQTSNEVSGRAITARQRVSELGDVIYTENFNMALAECGRVMNELIPEIYDTRRVVKVTGEDDEETMQVINDDFNDATPDVTKGKYDLTYDTGPSYATKRQESVDIILTMMNHMPQLGQVAGDIIFRNLDVPGAEELQERMAMLLPEGMLDPERLTGRRRERYEQLMQQNRAAQEAQMEQQQAMFMLGVQKELATIGEMVARAVKQEVQAMKDGSEIGVQARKVELEDDANEIKAAQVGVQIDQQEIDIVSQGLAAAQAVGQQTQERQQAAQNPQGQTGE